MTDTPVTHHLRRDLSIDQQVALKTAATRLMRDFDGTFGVETDRKSTRLNSRHWRV